MIIPDSAHGTNPASVTLGGYQTVTVPSDHRGLVDLDALRARLDTDVAGIMLTNPNTLGLFEEDIAEIAAAVHEVGGLLYYDGANLNAILGVTRPGRHGLRHRAHEPPQDLRGSPRRRRPGRRTGRRLRPPGRLPARPAAGAHARRHASPGRRPPAASAGSTPGTATPWPWPGPGPTSWPTAATASGGSPRAPCSTPTGCATGCGASTTCPTTGPTCTSSWPPPPASRRPRALRALDVGKRLLEEGFHAPTVYFPLIVDEALMIEPTETESPQQYVLVAENNDNIVDKMASAATIARNICRRREAIFSEELGGLELVLGSQALAD